MILTRVKFEHTFKYVIHVTYATTVIVHINAVNNNYVGLPYYVLIDVVIKNHVRVNSTILTSRS